MICTADGSSPSRTETKGDLRIGVWDRQFRVRSRPTLQDFDGEGPWVVRILPTRQQFQLRAFLARTKGSAISPRAQPGQGRRRHGSDVNDARQDGRYPPVAVPFKDPYLWHDCPDQARSGFAAIKGRHSTARNAIVRPATARYSRPIRVRLCSRGPTFRSMLLVPLHRTVSANTVARPNPVSFTLAVPAHRASVFERTPSRVASFLREYRKT